MNTFVALLRGINVSGQKKVPMLQLRQLMERLGFKNVQTYIQSGNVIFWSSVLQKEVITKQISEGIKNEFGFEVAVLVLNKTELAFICNACPFSEDKKQSSYFTLLHTPPERTLITALSELQLEGELFDVSEKCVYLYVSQGYGKAKGNTNFFERKLKVEATTRNFKTMEKLLSLCSDL